VGSAAAAGSSYDEIKQAQNDGDLQAIEGDGDSDGTGIPDDFACNFCTYASLSVMFFTLRISYFSLYLAKLRSKGAMISLANNL
jgi:hypothetical protein